MKNRRELLSGFIIDICKALVVTLIIGRLVNPDLISLKLSLYGGLLATVLVTTAWFVHPQFPKKEK